MFRISLLLLTALLAGCQMNAVTKTASTSSIKIVDMAFDPQTAKSSVGSEITFTNKDSVGHSIVWDDVPSGATVNNSKTLGNGGSYAFTPTVKGTYHYHCGIHPSMKGTLVIG